MGKTAGTTRNVMEQLPGKLAMALLMTLAAGGGLGAGQWLLVDDQGRPVLAGGGQVTRADVARLEKKLDDILPLPERVHALEQRVAKNENELARWREYTRELDQVAAKMATVALDVAAIRAEQRDQGAKLDTVRGAVIKLEAVAGRE